MVEKDAVDASIARRKAAAWAWYQRAGGALPAVGRSEAFAARSCGPRTHSRFRLEVQALREAPRDREAWEGSSGRRSVSSASDQDCLDLVSVDLSWDCGSSLFDSFELVALSKKLDAGLSSDPFEKPWPQSDEQVFKFGSLSSISSDFPEESLKHPKFDAPALQAGSYELDHKAFLAKYPYHGTETEKKSDHEKFSKQAIYDMFSHYSPAAHEKKMDLGKRSKNGKCNCAESCDDKKHKVKHRMSLHSLSKALQHIAHLAHSGDHHQREQHYHYDYVSQPHGSSKSLRQFNHSSPSREDDPDCRRQPHDLQLQHKHFHHHYHHHYHYLFHSDDGFRLQPSDKSLIVATAGLRTPKISPLPSTLPFEIPRIDAVDHGKRGRDGF